MSVKELQRPNVPSVVPEKKVAPPPKYRAIYSQDQDFICGCNIGLLVSVFSMSAKRAESHILRAIIAGEETVLVGTKDVVETKVEMALEAAHGPGACFKLSSVHFRVDLA